MNVHQLKENEKKNNLMALVCTIISCLIVFILCILWRWSTSLPMVAAQTQPDDGGVEVNFGNSDQGLGNIAPQVPGDPAPETAQQEENTTPPPTASQINDATPDNSYKEVADNKDEDVPTIKTSPKPTVKKDIPVEKKITKPVEKVIATKKAPTENKSAVMKPSRAKTATTATATSSQPARAKAVYKGGNGTGGNGADSYNGVSNQGIAGGRGDQGKMTGNPNSDSYNGTGTGHSGSGSGSGNSGAEITEGLGGRRFLSTPNFRDKFNHNARVAVKVVVNSSGQVTSAAINPRGTTTTDATIRNIALRRARQLKFSNSDADAQSGTIMFNFRVTEN